MLLLQTNNISKSFLSKPILSNINIQIHSKERIGLVGINGAGKSTLLKIIAGELLPETGEIHTGKGVTLGYLAQDSGLESNSSIWEEMLSVFNDLIIQEKQIRHLEQQISQASPNESFEDYEKLMNSYALKLETFKENGGYSYEAKVRGVLHGLGFAHFNYTDTMIQALSGGQKTRLAMAKILLTEPDILILDEPTNYLDMETMAWLEGYLKNYPGSILVVSHDRYFLDQLVTTIYEIERTEATRYVGNYSSYIDQKAKNLEVELKKFDKQQAEIAKLEDFVQRNLARASTTRRAQSKRKALEKMEKIDKPLAGQKTAYFSFDIETLSGNQVLNVEQLTMKFGERQLFQNVSFNIERGERVALIGPNGIGKSTLLKLIMNQISPNKGTIRYGSNVDIGYYEQEQNNLNLEKTVLDELWDEYPTMPEKEIRTILGNFLFIGDDVLKKIKTLSGGEKARVSLAKLMLEKANFLLLDEPTNHLDIYSREVLENSLIDYPGTVLFISHDRYFLNRLTTRTLELNHSGTTQYLGNYSYYLEKKAEEMEIIAEEGSKVEVVQTQGPQSDKEQYVRDREKQKIERQLTRKIASLELEIEKVEIKIDELEAELLKPDVYSNHELANKVTLEIESLKNLVDEYLEEWQKKQVELEKI